MHKNFLFQHFSNFSIVNLTQLKIYFKKDYLEEKKRKLEEFEKTSERSLIKKESDLFKGLRIFINGYTGNLFHYL